VRLTVSNGAVKTCLQNKLLYYYYTTSVLQLSGLCPGLPGWAGTRIILDFTEARDSEWPWQQMGHMQICTLSLTDNHARTPPLSFFTGRMPFLPPNQQCQSTEGNRISYYVLRIDIADYW